MNPKIQRNFEVFSPWDFIARITQHIPDKSFQLVRYYGWYSNKMRGQRLKRTDPETGAAPVSDHHNWSAIQPPETTPDQNAQPTKMEVTGPYRSNISQKRRFVSPPL